MQAQKSAVWAETSTTCLVHSDRFTRANASRTQLELKWQSYDRVGRVVYGVVFSLTQFDSVELVVSSPIK